jgi:hypothetical protein
MLTREKILSLRTLPTEKVEVAQLGGWVLVRGLTGKERDAFETSMFVERKLDGGKVERKTDVANLRARLVVKCLVDEQGERLFEDAEAEILGDIDGSVLDRLFDVAQRLSGMAPGQIEGAAKN